ncbi:uncharacterized protein LOC110730957 [Chenopodium quinoa]|uniref:uncharacterized protein LOC110730957 n=1 Tax=Chenopodium quinoa TaxID=63459 RepID=UPI000B76EC7A|nr:uncharacterized protein LOC110730957 [Chenopodium quinoa]
MVLQLIKGLPKGEYDTLATMTQQSDPLPSFNKVRSQFFLEETRRAKQEESNPQALVAQQPPATSLHHLSPQQQPDSQSRSEGRDGRGKGRNNWKGGKGRGRGGRSNSQGYNNQQKKCPMPTSSSMGRPTILATTILLTTSAMGFPPCPYPTGPPNTSSPRPQQGILGSRPSQQAFFAPMKQQQHSYGPLMSPTDLGQAYSTMSIQPPDSGCYMDTGASSHLTRNSGSMYGENSSEMQ